MTNGNASNERLARIEATMVRIAERHEALAQTVEILGGMQKVTESKMVELEGHMAKLMVTMDRLANIGKERLDAIDGGDKS